VDNFCYPAGRYDDAAIAALKAAGYRGATAENYGLASRSGPYVLSRIEIELHDGLAGFVEKLQQAPE
jgi:peptidoglycan/xylan/chitin deacetylase (PgdA/CDA1 family)